MQSPLQLKFEHVDASPAVGARVHDEMAKLEQFYDRITSARVVVARPQHRHKQGDIFQIRIHLTIPGGPDIDVSREPGATGAHEDVYVTIRDAFAAARRQLQDIARKRQGQVKAHEVPPHGRITALQFDHGFIASADGREIYFHRNAVADGDFDALAVGQSVRFSEAIGDKGPQATIVHTVGKHHSG